MNSNPFRIDFLERLVQEWREKIKRIQRHKFMNPGVAYSGNPGFYDAWLASCERNLAVAMDALDRAKLRGKV